MPSSVSFSATGFPAPRTTRAAALLLVMTMGACGDGDPPGYATAATASHEPRSESTVASATTASGAARGSAIFTDATADSGVAFRHRSGAAGDYYFPEIMGAGVGLLDYDGDGDLDVYLVQSGSLRPSAATAEAGEGARPPPAPGDAGDRLYRNDHAHGGGDGRLRFTDVTEVAGLRGSSYGMGVAAGDYDNDGWIDLFVASFGPDRLLRNRGDGTFEDVTRATGAADTRWSVSASFLDYDRDGWLDLFVTHYVDATLANHKECRAAAGYRDYCGPLVYRPVPSCLLRNLRDGTFRDVSAAAGLDGAYGGALGVLAADFDGDGWIDVYVANDQSANQLWLNRGDGTFVDEALLRGAALDGNGQPQASMGVDLGDVDGDGDDDLFLSHLAGETDTLYLDEGSGLFRDATAESNLAEPGLSHTGFGAAFLDYDNDGWLDLFMANGAVTIVEALHARGDPHPFHQPNQLLRNRGGGRFEDVTASAGPALALLETSRGAAFGDLDDDGDTDVVVANNDGPVRVLRNEVGSRRAWLGLRLVGRAAGAAGERDQLGARVELLRDGAPALGRRARADGSYASANDPRVLFGLGRPADAAPERVRVTWPDGGVETWDGLAAGRYHTLRRGDGRPAAPERDAAPSAGAATAERRGPAPPEAAGAGADAVAAFADDKPADDTPDDAAADAPTATGAPGAVPHPDLSRLEPAVAAQIAAARAAAEAREAAGASAVERAAALGELGRVYHAYELYDGAAASYRGADALDAGDGRWAYLLGALEQRRGRPRAAVSALRRALTSDPGSLAAWLRLGDQELELGRVGAARAAFERAAAIRPDEAAALYGLGRVARAERDWRAARVLFERALAVQPEATLLHYTLGQTCRELGDDEAARRHLALAGQAPVRFHDPAMVAVEALAGGAAAHLAAGARAYTLGDWTTAIAEHRRAIAADPSSVEARLGLATSLSAAGERHRGEAQAILREAARLAPERPEVRFTVAVELAVLGETGEADTELDRVVELDPGHIEARLRLADARARRQDWPAALGHYDAVLAREPGRIDVAVKKATVLYVASRHREARVALEAALETAPRDPLARGAMTRLLASCPDRSLRDARRALSMAESLFDEEASIENAELVAMAHAEAGDFVEAVEWQRRALDAAESAGAAELAATLRRNLDRYERGESCCA